jgi:DNA polymerase-3 subunit alpha
VKCGALDSCAHTRKGMLEVLEQAAAWGAKQQSDRLLGQASIFDLGDAVDAQPKHHPVVPHEEFEKSELLRLEKETLGLYVSEHPLYAIREQLRRKTDCTLAELERRRDGEVVTVGGIVAGVKQLTTKKGDPMVFLRLEDVTGGAEAVVFNTLYVTARDLCAQDRILIVKGRIDHKEGETKLLAAEVAAFESVQENPEVRLRLDAGKARAGLIRELAAVVRDFPGESRMFVDVEMTIGRRTLELGQKVRASPDFYAEVKALLGEAALL